MKFGAHVSIAGGIPNAPERARKLGCECFQMFTRSPRGGNPPELGEELLESFFLHRDETGIRDYYVHTPYFINLASPEKQIRESSVNIVRQELERSSVLEVKYVMTHIGSAKNVERGAALENVVDSLNRILGNYQGGTRLLLENTAGQGSTIGASFEEIAEILRRAGHEDLGVCVDTAHVFASGYDIRTAEDIKTLVEIIRGTVTQEKVKLIHGNDSKVAFNSGKDRHEHIGRGEIGIDCFAAMVENPFFAKLDLIVETPPPDVAEDVAVLKELRDGRGNRPTVVQN